AALNRADMKALAAADALASLERDRHRANWAVAGVETGLPLLAEAAPAEEAPELPAPDEGAQVLADYEHLGLSLRRHPLALLRPQLERLRFLTAKDVGGRPPGLMVRAAGLVLTRQRPGKGNAVFITLEDETGVLNLIVWRHLAERQRRVLLEAKLLGVWAEIQRADGVQHLIARRLYDYSTLLGGLPLRSRDFQ
ncbi:OB-fold nucleic acid binding domain-containing protein, partial [Thiolapillus sp.]